MGCADRGRLKKKQKLNRTGIGHFRVTLFFEQGQEQNNKKITDWLKSDYSELFSVTTEAGELHSHAHRNWCSWGVLAATFFFPDFLEGWTAR